MAVLRRTVTKAWLNGWPLDLAEPGGFTGDLDDLGRVGGGPWTFTASIPAYGVPWQEMTIAAELEDGTIVRGRCRLAWTPDDPDVCLFEGVGRPDEWS